jgi:uncharacterized protein YbjT (DUF2867 family)
VADNPHDPKIVIFGATGTIGKAIVAELLPKYELLQVANPQGQFKANLADADSIRNVFQAIGKWMVLSVLPVPRDSRR